MAKPRDIAPHGQLQGDGDWGRGAGDQRPGHNHQGDRNAQGGVSQQTEERWIRESEQADRIPAGSTPAREAKINRELAAMMRKDPHFRDGILGVYEDKSPDEPHHHHGHPHSKGKPTNHR